ncbi:sulfite oxidase-like oxidoreductase [Levilinea saccharolytica]|uniref:Oxidoreductase n=1 Tax=Levilinea saccharolytica TaxID=229921 RepID=A0A0N0RD62_9CHLR|nr:sulfite oxidase-like oxidoreductase [Levilinea saccharolytica]KPL87457.1 oxidoreductase [Levilinea saccharolytica]GAP19696.1 sulfite oxidase [Levilinea saccharolytica]
MFDSFLRRREDEKRMIDEGRLPPGQAVTNKFPVLHYGPVPHFNPDTWTFRVYGAVESPLELSWEQFRALPSTRMTLDLHCVTAWSKFDTQWEGLAVRTLIEAGLVRPLPNARFVIQHAEYGYTTNLPLEIVLSDNFLLAYRYEGQPLTPDHGHPLRGVVGAVPGRADLKTPYLWKGAKWLRGLEFSAEDRPGFWERAGYHNEADVWKEERYG